MACQSVNSYSGQCATMKAVKAANDGDASEYRSWTAIGIRGEAYVTFFNRSPQGIEISSILADSAKAVPVLYSTTCTCREIWTQTGIRGSKRFIINEHTFAWCCIVYSKMSCAVMGQTGFFITGVESQDTRANTPPRGWNSYDSYSWIITEEDFLKNAEILATLTDHGYEYAVVDYLWYRKTVNGSDANSKGFDVIDEWGRMIPDPDRWPSSKGGKGFKEVADKVHKLGLKFGIHVMRGISTQAVTANTLILDITKGKAYEEGGRQWRAADIGQTEQTCAWMDNGFMSVNNDLGAGQAFLRSLYQQYADWGVDFVKNDCVFGDDLDLGQIQVVSKFLSELQRPILYSVSPGKRASPESAVDVSNIVNMYRITGDDWDEWGDVEAHFDVSREFASNKLIGSSGLKGKSWPDLDMLPMGWLTDPGVKEGPHRSSRLSLDEQRTQMTLWCMAKSPIMFGGDLENLDANTLNIITNPELLEINSYSLFNAEFPFISGTPARRSNKNRFLTNRTKTVKEVKRMDTHVLGLTSCKNQEAKGWVIEALDKETERVCWKYPLGRSYKPRFCLNKRKPVLTVKEERVYEQRYKGKHHLLAADKEDLCLNGSPTRRLTSNEIHSSSFSPCKWHANQMWELNLNGTLVNSYSGQCATMKAVKAAANDDIGEYRSWTAVGKRAECYVAFFNVSPQRMEISAKLSDLAKGLPVTNNCTYREIWTQTGITQVKESISMSIASHGVALFVLECSDD